MKLLSLLVCVILLSTGLNGQRDLNVPTVFKTGLHEKAYEQIVVDHPTMLLQACGNDMDKAYILWTDVLSRLEQLALKQDLDVRGLKIWINVFWDASGEVDHITYYPKPNSKNIDFTILDQVMNDVAGQLGIKTPESLTSGVSHYGSASFPIFHQQTNLEGN